MISFFNEFKGLLLVFHFMNAKVVNCANTVNFLDLEFQITIGRQQIDQILFVDFYHRATKPI